MATKATAPKGLGVKARAFWRSVVGTYDLRVDELRILEDACREIDMIERLEAAQRESPLMMPGSMGQMVASPLVQELRQHRALFKGLVAALKLPDENGESSVSANARAAVNARWAKHRGA